MHTHTIGITALLLTSAAHAQQSHSYEVSKDGHLLAVNLAEAPTGQRGVGVPFNAEPDQSVELRRQIGGLKVVDIDGDGNNDLVAVCYISNSFPPYDNAQDMIFFGNGAGINLTPGWLSNEDTHTGDVQVGDLDGDDRPDIVTIHGGLRRDSVRAYFNTGMGMPTAPGYTSNTSRTMWGTAGVLADMDQDGDLDLVTTNQGVSPDPYRPLLMFDNTGTTLTTGSVWQSADEAVQNGLDARDITGDGYPDLAVAKWVGFNSGLYFNTTGTPDSLPFVSVSIDDTDRGALFCDLENDGISEIAFGGDPSRVYDNVHGALIERYASNPPFAGPQEIGFFDVDGDGDEDFVEIHFSDGRGHIYLNRGGVLDTTPTWSYDASEVGTALAFGDLNSDGRDDLVLGYSGDTCIRVFFAQVPSCQADLTGDGSLDFFDISAFINAFAAMDPIADFDGNGTFDFFDVSGFVNAFGAGCP
ncbi:MAG: FG-GAP-like repeat-containing protein [Phycisphaerales bacterium JB047]